MNWAPIILMNPDDEVGLLTNEGKMVGICAESLEYVQKNADRLHEAMIAVMKVPEHREGLWVWKVCHGWTQVVGEQILNKGSQYGF